MVATSVCTLREIFSLCIDIDQSALSTIVDVFGNGEREREFTIAHTTATVEQHLGTVFILESLCSSVDGSIVQLTGDGFLRIPHRGIYGSLEVTVLDAIPFNMTSYRSDGTSFQLG